MTTTARCQIALLAVVAIALVPVTRGRADDAPPPADAARQNEKYAIPPSAEPLLSEMLGRGQGLSGGCTFTDGRIERTYVLATYACGTKKIELQLLHPELAPPGGVRTKKFAIAVRDAT